MIAVTTLLSFLLLYKYVALFLIVFSIAIILPLPANVPLLAAGAFSSLGYFNFPLTIAVAVVANVAGDLIDFSLARRFGSRVLIFFGIRKHSSVVRIEKQLRQNAPFTIFITRFVGPLDLIVNLSSGVAQVSFGTFIAYDFLGNFLSNVLVIGVGYIAGISWQNFSGTVDLVSSILLVAIIIFFIVRYFFLRRKKRSLLRSSDDK